MDDKDYLTTWDCLVYLFQFDVQMKIIKHPSVVKYWNEDVYFNMLAIAEGRA